MNQFEAYELGEEAGFNDGYDGNAYDAYDDTVPEDLDIHFRDGYRAGYEDGQAAYRRTFP